ncbi:MAG: TonB-dependent receptor [Pseudomonadota bacterium]|nr:TonB-dependent receptor [Pseudomonadota bacterium]
MIRHPAATWSLALLAGLPTAFAATPASNTVQTLEPVVVTGTRTEHRVSDSPVDVQLITETDIRRSGARDVAELLEREGGVYVSRQAGRGTRIEMQGLASEHVLILINGQRVIGRVNGAIDLTRLRVAQIQRIEIVKGPSSALYGSDALGGVVNIITRPPETGGTVALRADDRHQGDLFAFAGWRGDNLGTTLTAGYSRLRAYDLSPESAGEDGVDGVSRYASGTLDWQATDRASLGLYGAYSLDDTQRLDSGTGGARYDTIKRIEEARLQLTPRLRLGAQTDVRLDLGYQRYFDQYLQIQQNGDDQTDEETLDQIGQFGVQIDHLYGQHLITVGLEHQIETLEADRLEGDGERDRQAVFLQDDLALFDGVLTLVPGLRYDRDSLFGDQWSPKLAARLDLTQDWLLRLGYGHGYRAPDFKQLLLRFENTAVGYRVDGNPNLQPERSRGLNIGTTWLPSPSTSLAVTAFHNRVDDLIELVLVEPGPPTIYSYRNVARAQLTGADVQAQWRPWPSLQLRAGYGYLDSEDRDSGQALSGRPRHRANLALYLEQQRYALGLRGAWTGTRRFQVDVDSGGPPTAAGTAAAYTLLDARLEWRDLSPVHLATGIKNLLDEGDPRFLPIQPRTVYLELRRDF